MLWPVLTLKRQCALFQLILSDVSLADFGTWEGNSEMGPGCEYFPKNYNILYRQLTVDVKVC